MNWLNQQRLYFAKRHLESQLAKILDITQGHIQAKVPAGHKFYGILYKKAGKAIVAYQATEVKLGFPSTDYTEIVVGVPQLEQLEKLANGSPEQSKALLIIIGSAFAWFAGTFVIAITHNFYTWLVR